MNRRNFIIGAVSIPAAILTAKYLPTTESKWYDGLGDGLWGQFMYKGYPLGRPTQMLVTWRGGGSGELVATNPPIGIVDEIRVWRKEFGEIFIWRGNEATFLPYHTASLLVEVT